MHIKALETESHVAIKHLLKVVNHDNGRQVLMICKMIKPEELAKLTGKCSG